ncbi:MAG: M23 family metallopeptidase [Thermosynechococcaceae cyanobacterium]
MPYNHVQLVKKVVCSAAPYIFGSAALAVAALPTLETALSKYGLPLGAGQGTASIPDSEQDLYIFKLPEKLPEAQSSDYGLTIALQRLKEERAAHEAMQQALTEPKAIREPVLRELIEKQTAQDAQQQQEDLNAQQQDQQKRLNAKAAHEAKQQQLIEARSVLEAERQQQWLQAKAAREDRLRLLIEERSVREAASPRGVPIQRAGVSAEFGPRHNPFGKGTDFHEGIDLVGPHGSPIYATASGVVQRAQTGRKNGNYVVVDHGYGFQTLYAHLSGYVVKPRTKVERGQLLGYMGSTGRSTGPHLHYGIYKQGQAVDPYAYVYGADRPTIAQVSYVCGRLVPNRLKAISIGTAQQCGQAMQ